MLRPILVFALALLSLPAFAQSGRSRVQVQSDAPSAANGIQIALQADTGKYLGRCHGCVPGAGSDAATDMATIHVESNNPATLPAYARFTMVPNGDGRVALRSDEGMYVARCEGCTTVREGGINEVANIHVRQPSEGPWALFTPQRMANGKYVFQSDNGRYLARCNGCIEGSLQPDVAMMHEASPDAAWAQWNVVWLP